MDDEGYRRRIEALKGAYVPVRRARRIVDALDELRAGFGTGDEGNCLFIVGPTGTGKSLPARRWVRNLPAMPRKRTAVMFDVPVDCTLKSLAGALLTATNDTKPAVGNQVEFTERALHRIRKLGTEVIIANEAQHLLHSKTDQVIYETSEYIKALVNANACQIVLIGQPQCLRLADANAQMERRDLGYVYTSPYDWRDEDDQDEVRIILREMERLLELDLPSNLYAYDTALRIYNAAEGGLLGHIARLLGKSLWLIKQRGLPRISHEVLAEAADALRRPGDRRVNPFRMEDAKPVKPPGPHHGLGRKSGEAARNRRSRNADDDQGD